MSVETFEIPQADRLEKVIQTVEAINSGHHTDEEIAEQLGRERGRAYAPRQGRYYRLATELLGFTRRRSDNYSVLTDEGRTLLHGNQSRRREILRGRVVTLPAFSNVLAMLESSGGRTSETSIIDSLRVMANTELSMARRRLHTMVAWMTELGIASKVGNNLVLDDVPQSLQTIEVPNIDVPVLPRAGDLERFREVRRRVHAANQTIIHEIDGALLERRNATHQRLTALLSQKINHAGAIPTSNRLIDLATHIQNHDYIIEVKSTVDVMRNQVRRGIAQLYEYRYLQGLPNARLVLCIERPLEHDDRWMVDYVTHDRGICLIWDDRENELFTNEECEDIPFL